MNKKPMKLLLFEWLTSGGLWRDGARPDLDCSMQRQGREMLRAITEDFLGFGIEILLPIDGRMTELIPDQIGLEKRQVELTDDLASKLVEFGDQVDHVMLIAPESEGCLSSCIEWLGPMAEKLISPDAEFAAIASDKESTFKHLSAHGFTRFPAGGNLGEQLSQGKAIEDFPLPAVLKPNDGAGSEEVTLVTDWSAAISQLTKPADHYRVEAFIGGTPVSVSVLCGGASNEVLVPTVQIFDREPFGHYVGAGYPVDSVVADRAIEMVTEVVTVLPATRGYIGMDMVIGETRQGDCLIEINPRLTMSYLKLREIYPDNLARRMLDRAMEDSSDPIRNCTFRAPCP